MILDKDGPLRMAADSGDWSALPAWLDDVCDLNCKTTFSFIRSLEALFSLNV